MNTHDIDIELPPLPEPGEAMSKWAYDESDMQDYARAAIEADRKRRQSEAEEVCAEAYQVVGSLLSDLGIFETDYAKKILDNLSQAKMVHKDVLPWPSFDRQHRDVNSTHTLGEPVGYIMPTALKQLKAGGNAIVGGVSQGCDVPIYTAPQPAEPVKVPTKEQLKVLAAHHCLVATKPDGEWRFEFNVDQLAGFIQELFERYTPRENGT